MSFIRKLFAFFWPPRVWARVIRVGALVLVVVLIMRIGGEAPASDEATALLPVVYVSTAAGITAGEETSFVGNVRAVSEARIQSEVGGRVTAVHVQPGDSVAAGTVLATLENASQHAALLQAQGAYEAALASAAQSELSVGGAANTLRAAQNNALQTYRDAFATVSGAVFNTIDVFYSDPHSVLSPNIRISTDGNASTLNRARIDLGKVIKAWQTSANELDTTDDLSTALVVASGYVQQTLAMADALIVAASKSGSSTIEDKPASSYVSDLVTARSALNASRGALATAETTLVDAREGVQRAELGGGTEASLASAQVKQALGALRSAEANYERTVFRTPIAGTVNNIRINVGDFVSASAPVAEVANNDALQISIFVSEQDVPHFTIGETVLLGNDIEGKIVTIAPAIDPITQKIEVKIAAESTALTNGSVVTVRIEHATGTAESDAPLRIPITAVKFSATDGIVFIVEDGALVAVPVEIGAVSGSFVTIESGITVDTVFVIDARGLTPGQRVEAVTR